MKCGPTFPGIWGTLRAAIVVLRVGDGFSPTVNTDTGHAGGIRFESTSVGPAGVGRRWRVPITTDTRWNICTIHLIGPGGNAGGGATANGHAGVLAQGGGGGGGGGYATISFAITPAMRNVALTGYIGPTSGPIGGGGFSQPLPDNGNAGGTSPATSPTSEHTTFDGGILGIAAAEATRGGGGQGGVFANSAAGMTGGAGGVGGIPILGAGWTGQAGQAGGDAGNGAPVAGGDAAANEAPGGGGGGSYLGPTDQAGGDGGSSMVSGGLAQLDLTGSFVRDGQPATYSAALSNWFGGGGAGSHGQPEPRSSDLDGAGLLAPIQQPGGRGGLGAGAGGGGGVQDGGGEGGGQGGEGFVAVVFT